MEKYKKICFVVPGSINQLTGGYIYDKKIISGLNNYGHEVLVQELSGVFPLADLDTSKNAHRQINKISTDIFVIDGLALPAFSNEEIRTFCALIHHPLHKETGLIKTEKEYLFKKEKNSLKAVRHIIVTSEFTKKELLNEFELDESKISVVCPGNKKIEIFSKPQNSEVHLLCVASVVARKGYDILLKALAELKNLPWKLTCVGSIDREQRTFSSIQNFIKENDLGHKVIFTGELSEESLASKYLEADIFVLASYYEGYGMALTEAICHELPVVATTGGAIPYVLGAECSVLVTPGNVVEMSQALHKVITDKSFRYNLHERAMLRKQTLPTWNDSCQKFHRIVNAL